MKSVSKTGLLKIFFAASACSWMPHWACHYYRLETGSSFVVGSWAFSFRESVVSLLIYSLLVGFSLIAIQAEKYRFIVAAISGMGHLSLGALHVYRLIYPFTFQVFGYPWSYGASLREALIVLPFGLVSIAVAISIRTIEKKPKWKKMSDML
jgi:hypothetical protein